MAMGFEGIARGGRDTEGRRSAYDRAESGAEMGGGAALRGGTSGGETSVGKTLGGVAGVGAADGGDADAGVADGGKAEAGVADCREADGRSCGRRLRLRCPR
ncbi:hypothetical protein GCM10010486_51840 [Nonomuraea roseoviolacea subsp. carminata]